MTDTYTALDKLKEVEREIAMRVRHYPGMIERGTLKMEDATKQMNIMRAIAIDLFRIVERERRAAELPLDEPDTILSGG